MRRRVAKLPRVGSKWLGITSSTKTSEKKVKRRRRAPSFAMKKYDKASRDKGRFNAFHVNDEIKDEVGNTVNVVKVVSPETGIHSRQWALAIVPQSSLLLNLPLEIRNRIWKICLLEGRDQLTYNGAITPHRNRGKFRGANYITIVYEMLSLISRQTYVDVVGSGLFYRLPRFSFTSVELMTNYIGRINPAHTKHCLRSLSVQTRGLTKRLMDMLGEMEGLRDLEIAYFGAKNDDTEYITVQGKSYTMFTEKVLKKLKDNKGWAALKGRLEAFAWCWNRGHGEDNPRHAKFVEELSEMLIGRKKWVGA